MKKAETEMYSHNLRTTVFCVLVSIAVLGCGPKQTSTGDTQGASATGGEISIKGSDTMVHVVTAWADAFMKKRSDIKISVTGGGSGTGVAALLNGTTDVCASSRDLSEEEKKAGESQGLKLSVTIVARDALSIVVHPSNPVNELTLEQIERIYTGAITNWSEVGGANESIVVTSRESSSGTYMFFLEHVLRKKDYTQNALLLPATSAIVQSVSDSSSAIGYVGLGYVHEAGAKLKSVGVKATPDAPAVMPTTETVLSGAYSISRPLLLVVAKEATGPVKDFLDFCVSDEGQAIVEESGYVKVQ
ncbi:MAG: phosphate ABC transporter substrate-binding protein [Candidatus Hydrogenedentes bacterium]|nr:phosphate ABC transporter substrate-binding protein [Candidatus Hydrogenedentota bacterium]